MNLQTLKFNFDRKSGLPKYLQLVEALEEWIRTESATPGEKLPSDRQLAEYLKISSLTVTRSVNVLVERQLLRRQVGSGTYVASAFSGPDWSQRHRLAIVHHRTITEDAGAWVTPIIAYWQAHWRDIVLLVGQPEDYRKFFAEYDLCGMVVLAPEAAFKPQILHLIDEHYPIVTLGTRDAQHPEIFFGSNHEKFARAATNYLIQSGHRRIGVIADAATAVQELRVSGFMQAMFEADLPVHPAWIQRYDSRTGHMMSAIKALLTVKKNGVTAVVLTQCCQLQCFYECARQLEIRIPQDVSVISFDNPDYAREISPPVTVVVQPIKVICANASRQLENLINRRKMEVFPELNPQLIERASCVPITD